MQCDLVSGQPIAGPAAPPTEKARELAVQIGVGHVGMDVVSACHRTRVAELLRGDVDRLNHDLLPVFGSKVGAQMGKCHGRPAPGTDSG